MSKLPEACQLRGYSCATQPELSGPLSPPTFCSTCSDFLGALLGTCFPTCDLVHPSEIKHSPSFGVYLWLPFWAKVQIWPWTMWSQGFPDSSVGKEYTCNAGDLGLIPGLGRSPGEGNGYLLQYSGLEDSMDCIVHGAAKRWTWLSDFHFMWFLSALIKHLGGSPKCRPLSLGPNPGISRKTLSQASPLLCPVENGTYLWSMLKTPKTLREQWRRSLSSGSLPFHLLYIDQPTPSRINVKRQGCYQRMSKCRSYASWCLV